MKTAYFKYLADEKSFWVVLMANGVTKDNFLTRSKDKAEAYCKAWIKGFKA